MLCACGTAPSAARCVCRTLAAGLLRVRDATAVSCIGQRLRLISQGVEVASVRAAYVAV